MTTNKPPPTTIGNTLCLALLCAALLSSATGCGRVHHTSSYTVSDNYLLFTTQGVVVWYYAGVGTIPTRDNMISLTEDRRYKLGLYTDRDFWNDRKTRFLVVHLKSTAPLERSDSLADHPVLLSGSNCYYGIAANYGPLAPTAESVFYGFFAYKDNGDSAAIDNTFGHYRDQYKGITIAADGPPHPKEVYLLFRIPLDLNKCVFSQGTNRVELVIGSKEGSGANDK